MNQLNSSIESLLFERVSPSAEELVELARLSEYPLCVEVVRLASNTLYRQHIHDDTSAKLLVLKGTGELLLVDECIPYKYNDAFDIPAGIAHGFRTVEQTYLLSIQANPIRNEKTGDLDFRYVKKE